MQQCLCLHFERLTVGTEILPHLFGPTQTVSVWTSAFCQYPVVCLSLKFAVAVHRDLMANQLCESQKPEAIKDKLMTIRLLNNILCRDLDETTLDVALLATCILANNELNQDIMEENNHSTRTSLRFSPPMPPSKQVRVYGHVSCVREHAIAAVQMVERRGGLHAIRFPGLAEKLA
jgi:hypothetical protein